MPHLIEPKDSPEKSFDVHRQNGMGAAEVSSDHTQHPNWPALPAWVIHCGLFTLTFVSVTLSQVPLRAEENFIDLAIMVAVAPHRLAPALPFSTVLMAILLAHEMGHYITARRFGAVQSLPYFIPAPTLFGTLGAIITLESEPSSRRCLLWIAVMGPLAGLAVAIPAMAWGMAHPATAQSPTAESLLLGNSLLLSGMSALFGLDDQQTLLHPVALAGWAGLFFTSLNLIPASQLDGGHMAYALFGSRQRFLSVAIALVLLVWGLVSLLLSLPADWGQSGAMWIVWGTMLFILGHRHPAVLDEALPLRTGDKIVAWVGFALFAVTFVPAPIRPH